MSRQCETHILRLRRGNKQKNKPISASAPTKGHARPLTANPHRTGAKGKQADTKFTKLISKNFSKKLDILIRVCYNKDNERGKNLKRKDNEK